jgi:hypothetical protein
MMSAKNKTILFVFSVSAVLVTEGTVTLVTLPLGLFAGFRVFISTLACCGVHFSTNTFNHLYNHVIENNIVILNDDTGTRLNPINMETSSIDLSLVNTSIGPHCTW